MAATEGQAAFGTLLKYGAAGVLTAIGELTNIDGPGMTGGSVDLTHNTSPGATREKAPGIVDAGQVSVDGNATNTAIAALHALWRTEKQWQIVYPNLDTWNFDGFIVDLHPGAEMEGKVAFSMTIEITGLPRYLSTDSTWSS